MLKFPEVLIWNITLLACMTQTHSKCRVSDNNWVCLKKIVFVCVHTAWLLNNETHAVVLLLIKIKTFILITFHFMLRRLLFHFWSRLEMSSLEFKLDFREKKEVAWCWIT